MHGILAVLLMVVPGLALASGSGENLGMINHWAGYLALSIFVVAYAVVMMEEFIHLRKSKPVIMAAGLIWLIVALLVKQSPLDEHALEEILQHNLIEYASLFLFLLVAMTYI
ncbi:MAG: sodium:proton antiporter, partial [Gammaproteobacteria bacterium]|nr:sodium:proton antiporter [Gammaproteobacteria bacterium]